ncbi:hypothetical protein [Streptomyces luteogriseus]|uniref:hypothetical protein n=1 Tax=Streptomyces luteogriseus TaxID=68233 RepID=UPI003FA3457C
MTSYKGVPRERWRWSALLTFERFKVGHMSGNIHLYLDITNLASPEEADAVGVTVEEAFKGAVTLLGA